MSAETYLDMVDGPLPSMRAARLALRRAWWGSPVVVAGPEGETAYRSLQAAADATGVTMNAIFRHLEGSNTFWRPGGYRFTLREAPPADR